MSRAFSILQTFLCTTALLTTSGVWAEELRCASCRVKTEAAIDEFISQTAPVIEPDWEELLRVRVAEAQRLGLFARAQTRTRRMLERHARTPVSIAMPTAESAALRRIVILDAEAVGRMSQAVRDVLSGFSRGYVFFDADHAGQRAFVRTLIDKDPFIKAVAIAGDVSEASCKTGMRIYADQGGVLTRRFDLKAVPSVVRLVFDGRTASALIEETPIEANEADTINKTPESRRAPNRNTSSTEP